MKDLFKAVIGAEFLLYGPVYRLCSPSRSHLLIRDQLAEGGESPGHGDGSGFESDSSLSSRARRAAALRSEMPSLR